MIIVVGAEKGGVGKTAIATNLAALAAAEGVEVCLLDTDQQGSSTAWARIRNSEKVTPLIPVLTIPANPFNELSMLAPKFELIIVDIGAQNYITMENTAAIADMILIPCCADQLEVESTMKVCSILKSMDPRHKNKKVPAFIVLNKLPTNAKSKEGTQLREFFESESLAVFDSSLKDRGAWRNSRRGGLAVHELRGRDADTKATFEMVSIYEELKKRIGGG